MKQVNIKMLVTGFSVIIVTVNIMINIIFFLYLQGLNDKLVREECNRISYDIKENFEQSIDVVRLFSERIHRELFELDYFLYSNNEEYYDKSVSVQECVDTLNEFTAIPVHLLLVDVRNGQSRNYSRIMSQEMVQELHEIYEEMHQEQEWDQSTYSRYRILDMGESFWIIEMRSYLQHNYSILKNEEYGSILTTVIVSKKELYEKCGAPEEMEIFLYDISRGRAEAQRDSARIQENTSAVVADKEIITTNEDYLVRIVLQNGRGISNYEELRIMILLQLVINVVLTVFWMRIITRFIAKPLNMIVKHIKTVNFDDNRRMPEDFACMEIRDVASHFNRRTDRLNEEVAKVFYTQQRLYELELCEKERSLMALQSQINPHFIYNMLENIRVLAEDKRNEEVSAITVHMADFLRYSLYVNGFVTLGDELKSVKTYLKIMQICYDNQFEMAYEVEEGLEEIQVPKMILQPLIGNVFKHGFTFEHGHNMIRLVAKQMDGRIEISIYDNGIGIKREALDKLKMELSGSALLKNDRGFGLYSINRRIKTIYGDEYGVTVESCEKQYTVVTLSFSAEM